MSGVLRRRASSRKASERSRAARSMRSAAVRNDSTSSGERETTDASAESTCSRRRFASFSVSCSARDFWEAVACWFITGNNIERNYNFMIYAKVTSAVIAGSLTLVKSDICGLIQASAGTIFCLPCEQSLPLHA